MTGPREPDVAASPATHTSPSDDMSGDTAPHGIRSHDAVAHQDQPTDAPTPGDRARRLAHARARRRRLVLAATASILTVATLVASALVVAGSWRSVGAEPAVPAARWLPPEGLTWEVLRAPNGSPLTVMSRLTVAGVSAPLALSDGLGASAVALADSEPAVVRTTTIGVRSASDSGPSAAGIGHTSHLVFVATAAGVLQTALDAGLQLLADPPILQLPPDPLATGSWASSTVLEYQGKPLLHLDMTLRATADDQAGTGCVAVDRHWVYSATPGGATAANVPAPQDDQVVWCPGAGPYLSNDVGPIGGPVDAATARAAVAALPVPAATTPGSGAAAGDVLHVWSRDVGSLPTADPVTVLADSPDPMIVDVDNATRGPRALSTTTGDEYFSIPGPAPIYARPAVAGDDLITADVAGNVMAVDVPSGFVRWRTSLSGVPRSVATIGTAAAPTAVAVLTTSGQLTLLDPTDGVVRATIDGGSAGIGLTANGHQAVAAFAGRLLWVGIDGTILADATPAQEPTTAPVLVPAAALPPSVRRVSGANGSTGAGDLVTVVGTVEGDLLAYTADGSALGTVQVFPLDQIDGLVCDDRSLAAFTASGDQVAVLPNAASQAPLARLDLAAYTLAPVQPQGAGSSIATASSTGDEQSATTPAWIATTDKDVVLVNASGKLLRRIALPGPANTSPLRAAAHAVGGDIWVSTDRGLFVIGGGAR